jgi:KipI family sensor histidine kinase inhibitor
VRLLPCGDAALLVELPGLDEVLGLSAALRAAPPPGVEEVVPAARTVLVRCAPGALDAVAPATVPVDELEVPVVYDGADLDDAAGLLGWDGPELVRRHTGTTWTVAFCGFAPGFGYLVADGGWPQVPRRSSPRTRVPPGSVALAAEFSGVYPRESPGGWQLVGRTSLPVLDLDRDPPALLRPGVRVRFVDAG